MKQKKRQANAASQSSTKRKTKGRTKRKTKAKVRAGVAPAPAREAHALPKAAEKPPRGLSARQEKFCQIYIAGQTATEAYHQAYGNAKGAEASASRLLSSAKVAARVQALQQRGALAAVLTLAEKRQYLRRVVLTAIGDVDPSSDLCQSYKRREEGGDRGRLKRGKEESGNEKHEPEAEVIEIKMPDKLRAIELDATLAGELKPAVKVEAGDELLELLALIRSGK